MRGFESFKGRTVQVGDRVDVYRKIIGGKVYGPLIWSVRGADGLVRGHATALVLTDAVPYVNAAAAQRIRGGAAREVHAWVRGTLSEVTFTEQQIAREWDRHSYNPHHSDQFTRVRDGQPWTDRHPVVVFNEDGMFL